MRDALAERNQTNQTNETNQTVCLVSLVCFVGLVGRSFEPDLDKIKQTNETRQTRQTNHIHPPSGHSQESRVDSPGVAANPPKHFSLIREFHLADFLTLGNAASGLAAILFGMLYMGSRSPGHFFAATAMTPVAWLFDWLDGRVARWRRQHSALGRELDSLADIVSFGVAPAVLGFAAGLRGGWDWIALMYFVCCGVSRLARYNVTAESLSMGSDRVRYFEGTPIPTTGLLTAVLAVAAWQDRLGEHLYGGVWPVGPWDLHPLSLLFVLSGTLMISKTLRIPKI